MATTIRSSGKIARSFAISRKTSSNTSAATTKRFPQLHLVQKYHNNAVVARIKQELNLSQESALNLFQDTLKFLWLAAKFGGVVPSPLIDEGWHTFILFTRDYQEFCHKYFGVFIHHRPRRPEDKPDGGKLRRRTHALIAEHFGDSLSSNWNYKRLANGDCEQSCAPSRDCNGGETCS